MPMAAWPGEGEVLRRTLVVSGGGSTNLWLPRQGHCGTPLPRHFGGSYQRAIRKSEKSFACRSRSEECDPPAQCHRFVERSPWVRRQSDRYGEYGHDRLRQSSSDRNENRSAFHREFDARRLCRFLQRRFQHHHRIRAYSSRRISPSPFFVPADSVIFSPRRLHRTGVPSSSLMFIGLI